MKQRIDVWLTTRGMADSREKAQAMIMAGQVYVGEKKVLKASEQYAEDAPINLRGVQDAFASRGGHKLEKAITAFNADVAGLTAMDIGAATGGFTDVLLRHGAAHVYAIDVGYGQLDWRLRNDERVTVMERTNARNLTIDHFDRHPTLTVMDVSFISIKLILPVAAAIMGDEGRFLTLIKPQFEAGKGQVGKNGVVREKETHIRVLREICTFCPSFGWHVENLTFSPIKGPAGNIEFLADVRPGAGEEISDEFLEKLVNTAHTELKV
ncbi:MAG: TlyA family RNA methyltransferase [Clostridiales bacterium]|nr:TlyA family RNA methyltransferase [Clostridiales bacterium]